MDDDSTDDEVPIVHICKDGTVGTVYRSLKRHRPLPGKHPSNTGSTDGPPRRTKGVQIGRDTPQEEPMKVVLPRSSGYLQEKIVDPIHTPEKEFGNRMVFAGLSLWVVESGKAMGARRRGVLASSIEKNGGVITCSKPSHIISVLPGREEIKLELKKIGVDFSSDAHFARPEWVSESIIARGLLPLDQFLVPHTQANPLSNSTSERERPMISLGHPQILRSVDTGSIDTHGEPHSDIPAGDTRKFNDNIDAMGGFVGLFFNKCVKPEAVKKELKEEHTLANSTVVKWCPYFDEVLPSKIQHAKAEPVTQVKLPTSCSSIVPKVLSAETGRAVEGEKRFYDKKGFVFACQKGTPKKETDEDGNILVTEKINAATQKSPNEELIQQLQKLQKIYEQTGDNWRNYSYTRAIAILKKWQGPIRSAEELKGVRGIGDKIRTKVGEILETGTSRKAEALESNEEVTALREFGRIWSVGPATAKQFFLKGYRTLDDLRRISDTLTAQQRVGLAYVHEIQERIPRCEVAAIEAVVSEHARRLQRNLEIVTCGSYRRGQASSGDVDILICDLEGRTHDGILPLLIESLQNCDPPFITDVLSYGIQSTTTGDPDTFMGICQLPKCEQEESCKYTHMSDVISTEVTEAATPSRTPVSQMSNASVASLASRGTLKKTPQPLSTDPDSKRTHLHRRLDIKVYPKSMFPFAILYFTGSGYFNRSMRLYCHRMNLSLSDKGLVPVVRVKKNVVHEGPLIHCDSEREIFERLGLEYKHPTERDV